MFSKTPLRKKLVFTILISNTFTHVKLLDFFKMSLSKQGNQFKNHITAFNHNMILRNSVGILMPEPQCMSESRQHTVAHSKG